MLPLITPSEVADYLRVDVEIVEQAIREGKLAAFRLGDQYRTTWDAVQAYLRVSATVEDLVPAVAQPVIAPLDMASRSSRTGSTPGGGKYWRIGELLTNQRDSRVTFSFDKIEQEIGRELPRSAREHRAWWANTATSHPHAQSWLSNGWRVVAVNFTREEVTFERSGPDRI